MVNKPAHYGLKKLITIVDGEYYTLEYESEWNYVTRRVTQAGATSLMRIKQSHEFVPCGFLFDHERNSINVTKEAISGRVSS